MIPKTWIDRVPASITADPLWRVEAYRIALFLLDIAWEDVTKLSKDRRTVASADQLYRAVGSIQANVSEGYSRGSGRDRVRMYEYALGSAREARGWYHGARHVLGEEVVLHRIDLLTQVVKLVLVIIPNERRLDLGRSAKPGPPHATRSTEHAPVDENHDT